jgi:hypothetical protein
MDTSCTNRDQDPPTSTGEAAQGERTNMSLAAGLAFARERLLHSTLVEAVCSEKWEVASDWVHKLAASFKALSDPDDPHQWPGFPLDQGAKEAFLDLLKVHDRKLVEAAWESSPKGPAPGIAKWNGFRQDKLDAGLGPKMSVATWLKKQWAKVVEEQRIQDGVDSGRLLPASPDQWIFDAYEGGFRRRLSERSFSPAYSHQTFKTLFVHLNDELMRRFFTAIPKVEAHRQIFASKDTLVKEGERLVLNTYVPTSLVPAQGDWSCYGRLIEHLVGYRQRSYDHFMQTLAAPLQSLHLKGAPRHMGYYQLVFGHQGCGKDTLADVLRLLYGDANFKKLDQDAIDSRFNSQIRGKLLLHLNETISSTNRTMETSNKIKEMTTAPRLDIEGKGKDRETIEVHHNMIVTSNSERPLLLEHWDRRANPYYVKNPLPKELAKEIYDDLGSPAGCGSLTKLRAFFDHLLHGVNVALEYGQRDPENDIQMIIEQSLPPHMAFAQAVTRVGWLAVAEEFKALPGMGRWERTHYIVKGDPVVDAAHLYDVFGQWCRQNGYTSPPPKRTLKAAFRTVLKGEFDESRPKRKGDRVSFDAWHGVPLEPAGMSTAAGDGDLVAEDPPPLENRPSGEKKAA